jgi:hypothetical protein
VTEIFISYSRDDDLPPPDMPDRKGFVTFLEEFLRYKFKDLGPERPHTWRDIKRVSDGAQFTPEIEEALKKASILLVVLSPNWMASAWCKRELESFAKFHGPHGIRERIIVVGKRYVDPDKRPSLLQGQTGFAFFARNENPREIVGDVEFFRLGAVQNHERYWERFDALVAHLLRRRTLDRPEPVYPPTGRTIYVAKPASDMREAYDRIVAELVGKGHTVVPAPEDDIPTSSAVAVIDTALSNAEISVHLLGESGGDQPEGQLPMVSLQLARSTAKASEGGGTKFHRLIWAPSLWTTPPTATSPACEIPRNPIEVLVKFGGDLPTDKTQGDTLSKFVDFLDQHLKVITPPRPIATHLPEIRGDMRLFLYHSREDSDYAINLAEALQQRKLQPRLSVFDGPDADIENFNRKELAECDAVILCWASAKEVWVRAQAAGLRDWHDLRRTRQFFYRAVVAAPPPGNRKKAGKLLFPSSEIDLVVDLSENDPPTADLLDVLVPAAHASPP